MGKCLQRSRRRGYEPVATRITSVCPRCEDVGFVEHHVSRLWYRKAGPFMLREECDCVMGILGPP